MSVLVGMCYVCMYIHTYLVAVITRHDRNNWIVFALAPTKPASPPRQCPQTAARLLGDVGKGRVIALDRLGLLQRLVHTRRGHDGKLSVPGSHRTTFERRLLRHTKSDYRQPLVRTVKRVLRDENVCKWKAAKQRPKLTKDRAAKRLA
jgi:hypothetical protein